MGLPEQLAAMVFELKGAASPVAKAKALARAWRMVRRLSPADRMALAEEAGFEGAEDLLENLAAKKGGVAPALMLQFLNSLRDRGDEGLSNVMAGLRDPETRDQILIRGADAVAEAFGPEVAEDEEILDLLADSTEATAVAPNFQAPPLPVEDEDSVVGEAAAEPTRVDQPITETDSVAPEGAMEVVHEISEPSPVVSEADTPDVEIRPSERGSVDIGFLVEDLKDEVSLVDRLVCLREAIPALAPAVGECRHLVEAFPKGWPRRRALVALLGDGLPVDIGEAIDLIGDLESPADRRWCLGVLADSGDLEGAEAERAMGMTESPTLRRRISRQDGSSEYRAG
ncbi:MAG: hypothetical protein ABFS37_08175 [Acidobacteriota bacterium]